MQDITPPPQQAPEGPEAPQEQEQNSSGPAGKKATKMSPKTALLAVAAFGIIFIIGTALSASVLGLRVNAEYAPDTNKSSVNCADWGAPSDYQKVMEATANTQGQEIPPALLGAIFLSENGNDWPHQAMTDPWEMEGNVKGPFQFDQDTWNIDIQNFKKEGFTATDIGDFSKAVRVAAYKLWGIAKHHDWNLEKLTDNQIRCIAAGYNKGGAVCDAWANSGFAGDPASVDLEYDKRALQRFKELNKNCESGTNGGVGATGDKPYPEWDQSKRQDKAWKEYVNDRGKAYGANSKGGKTWVGEMEGGKPTGIVLHWTDGELEGAITTMGKNGTFVQLIIDDDTKGTVYQLMPLNVAVTSGSGDGSRFAVGIEIVTKNDKSSDVVEADLLTRSKKGNPQFDAVIDTINYLHDTYKIELIKGNETALDAKKGIFGHFQTQGHMPANTKENWQYPGPDYKARWNGLLKGCKGAKPDPGQTYMNRVWTAVGATDGGGAKCK